MIIPYISFLILYNRIISSMMIEDVTIRRREVMKIMAHLKKNGQRINRYTVKDQLDKLGFDMSVSTIYRDMTALNRENTWVRDLAESNYSAYQEEIDNNLEWVSHQVVKKFRDTGDHVWLNILLKTQESKMRHTAGENISVSVALLGEKYRKRMAELYQNNFPEEKDHLQLNDDTQSEYDDYSETVNVIKLCKEKQ